MTPMPSSCRRATAIEYFLLASMFGLVILGGASYLGAVATDMYLYIQVTMETAFNG